DRFAAAERLALDLGDAHALPAQVRGDDRLGRGPGLPAHLPVVPVGALPEERVFLDVLACLCGGSGHGDSSRRSRVTRSLVGDRLYFFERRYARLDLEQPRLSQVADAF